LRGRPGIGLGTAAVAAVVALAVPSAAAAETYDVNTTLDLPPDQVCDATDCTLREAVNAAGPDDVVRLPAGTYQLTHPDGELFLTSDTIQGAGARTTVIDAVNNSRVMWVTDGITQVSGVTITRGNGFGQNPSGGTDVVGPGGGIYVQSGVLFLSNSTVAGNGTTSAGGGVAAEGGFAASGTTVANNRASNGGGIAVADGGGASLINATVSGNIADTGRLTVGGGILAVGSLSLENVTVAGNQVRVNGVPAATGGGGIHKSSGQTAGTVTILDSIVASNTGRACDAASAALITAFGGDHNLDDDGTCGFSEAGDRPGVNPLLGPLANNGGPTDTRALAAGSPAINAGDGASCASTDQRGFARPAGACDIGAFEYFPPSQPPPSPPDDDDQLPPPIAGETVNALPKSGRVRVKVPGSRRFVRLTEGQQLPVGTIVDARKGHVTLIAAADKQGGTSTAEFWAGIFKLGQTKGDKPVTTLKLNEKLRCGSTRGKATTAAKRKKKRRLWGNGKGRFRTKGRYSAATVRGTKWLTKDRCNSTLTRVVRGRVAVRDFAKRRTVVVRAGKRYVAKRKK